MPGLPILSSKTVIKLLKQTGFEPAPKRGKGSHLAFVKKTPNKTYLLIVPHKNEIPHHRNHRPIFFLIKIESKKFL